MGIMRKASRTIGQVSLSALEDEWQRRATAAAIDGARGVVQVGGPILPATPIGRLSDVEWGWIVAAVLFRWIQARAEQATAEQLDTERTIRMTALDPDPWDAGAVEPGAVGPPPLKGGGCTMGCHSRRSGVTIAARMFLSGQFSPEPSFFGAPFSMPILPINTKPSSSL